LCAPRGQTLGGEYVGLNLCQRYGAIGKPAIGIERVLPSLIGETVFVCAGIFNEAVAIPVGRPIDPR